MKYILNLTWIAIFLLLTGCGKSFLELNNPAALTYDKFYKTEADFQAALDGCYFRLKNQAPYILTFNESTTDNTFVHIESSTYQQYQFNILAISSSSQFIQNFWQDSYQAIAYANLVISRIGGSEVPEATQKVFISEAKFLRALVYFNMVRVYGGVPLYAEEVTDLDAVYATKRASVDEVYDFIISDLSDAVNIDNDRTEQQRASAKNKATSAAVKALLGKVYLYRHDYEKALPLLTDVAETSGYGLTSLENLYNPDAESDNEVIFSINYERVDGQSCTFAYNFLPKYSRGILPNITSNDNGDGIYNLEDNTVNRFDRNDKRFTLLIDSLQTLSGGELKKFYYTKKYLDLGSVPAGGGYNSASDYIILRFADVLLMCADAKNQLGDTPGAYPYINRVRERAGLENLSPNLSEEQMNDAIAAERQKEFICEGDRWFDLNFRGFSYLQNMLNAFFPSSHRPSANVKDHMVLFPIPADQINLKPGVLEQNNGY